MILRSNHVTKQRWALGIALCVLVFVFAFNAKTAVYGRGPAGKVSPTTSTKLWLDGQKLQAKPSIPPPQLLWITVITLGLFSLYRESFVRRDTPVVIAKHLGLQDIYRSLRPPPTR